MVISNDIMLKVIFFCALVYAVAMSEQMDDGHDNVNPNTVNCTTYAQRNICYNHCDYYDDICINENRDAKGWEKCEMLYDKCLQDCCFKFRMD
ncbi:unnamed protein product [Callosobruchus maculatus]|uniref:Uncharacterized protein n=1 Tax=Callosobruchus maculatus TaxID=64391 RepID=A0A653CR14_CALMS|nr:unnamed protein product [Callosobruchus maculatus]